MIQNNKITNTLFHAFFLISFFLASYKIIYKLSFWEIPLIIFLIITPIAIKNSKKAILIFLFFLPIITSTAKFFDFGYPFNYMLLPLFFLSFIAIISLIKGELKIEFQRWQIPYLLFLTTLFLSSVFLWLKWLNFPNLLHDINADLFVSPDGNRISFASIFPIISLSLFAVAPYIKFLISSKKIKWDIALKMVQYGFLISIAIAFYQKFNPSFMMKESWAVSWLQRVNGGFSDFNALGTFSGLMFFLTIIAAIKNDKFISKEQILNLISILLCIVGIILSGSRSSLIILILSLLSIFLIKKTKIKTIIIFLAIILPVSSFLLNKSNIKIKERVKSDMSFLKGAIKEKSTKNLNNISNGRTEMLQNSIHILKKYPLCGIGNGNFLFYQRHSHFGEKFLDDTPLNQYLYIGVENGLISLIFFIIAFILLIKVQESKEIKILFLITAIIFMFNNYLWFPELSVFFWLIASGKQKEEQQKLTFKNKFLTFSAVLLIGIFILSNIINYQSLLPLNWSLKRRLTNRYGFWSYEKTQAGEVLWSKKNAGIALMLDEKGNSTDIEIIISAPIDKFPNKQQTLNLFWKGKHYKSMSFNENQVVKFQIKGNPNDCGYLELECCPPFTPSKVFEGNKDNRQLGIQLKLFKNKEKRYTY